MADFDGHEADPELHLGSYFGYRYWYLAENGLVSVSASNPNAAGKYPWHDGENVARCNRLDRDLPKLPGCPTEPTLPEILTVEEDVPANFNQFVQRARMVGGGYSFPTTERGEIIQPNYNVSYNAEWRKRRAEAQELYAEAMRTYKTEHDAWVEKNAEFQAERRAAHLVPVLGCQCGFYMVKDPVHAQRYTQANPKQPLIFGVVEGYGKVVVGEKGWRFERARIKGLVIDVGFVREIVRYRLNAQTKRIDLKQPTIDLYNSIRQQYTEPEFYKSEEELRIEWDDRVENS